MDIFLLSSPLLRILFGATGGAVLGYMFHGIIVLLLFHPVQPITIGPFTVHSYLLRLWNAKKETLAVFIAAEASSLIARGKQQQLATLQPFCINALKQWVDIFLQKQLPTLHPMANSIIKGTLGLQLRDMLVKELERLLVSILEHLDNVSPEPDIASLVLDRMGQCSMKNIAQTAHSLLKTEIRLFLTIGIVSGAFTGLLITLATVLL